MASSDDEEVVVPQSITNYHLVDKDDVPISFSTLPIVVHDDDKIEAPSCQISVRGTMDGGLQSVFKEVIAWKLTLDGDIPSVSLLSKDSKWIKLEKPKKSYEECIRTTLVTIHLLYFSKKNPEASLKSFWEYSRHALSSFEDRPSLDEFKDHLQVIKLFIDRDEALAKCQVLQAFVKNPEKSFVGEFHSSLEEKPFITDDLEEGVGIDEGEESEEESDLFDSVCSICDNGGELLCCEGRCLRSFHATRRAGADSDCASLGLTRIQVEAMQNFLCKNCQLKQHQCFACGKLGSSDKSANAEVFSCVSATCGRFYHPKCVAELLFPDNKIEATELGKKIAGGESFTCSVHRCIVCKQVENKEVEELQFAICRRCPKSYHRKCLPTKIAFDDDEDEDITQRAWDGLLPNRILIYCLKHEIDEELGTPFRNHIKFPEIPEKKRDMDSLGVKLKKSTPYSDRMTGDPKFLKPAKRLEKLPKSDSDDATLTGGKTTSKKILESHNKWKILQKGDKTSMKQLESKEHMKSGLTKVTRLSFDSEKALTNKAEVSNSALAVPGKLINTAPKILPEIRKDVLALVEEESSSLSQNDIRKMLSKPSTYSTAVGQIDKSITLGKIEGAIEAVRNALEKLEGGGNVEDAKAVCEPEILKRLIKWNVKLKVYLAPVLHGARYSSYGRHFTKFDKLQEIVDKLQWYVQDGDMIVDFCCGANEFSILMKEKLDYVGRKCLFKNYDILQAKNDFNFEMRDWMTVRTNELPTGSKLIMGLNPPFGLNARLANQFVDKALTFRPKLLILIVPEETRRLDTKSPQYDLIWEDKVSLSGKSFYLPGSIDVNDKQIEQWNVKPPVLYLWSRPDWTSKHNVVASIQGHASRLLPSFPVHKDSQVNSLEDTSLTNDNMEEKFEDKDATHGERESFLLKQKSMPMRHDRASSEPDSPAEGQFPAEKRADDLNLGDKKREADDKNKHVREKYEKRDAVPAQKELGREVYRKKLRVEEMPEKTSAAGRLDAAGKTISEQSKKRKSPELYDGVTRKKKMLEHKLRGQPQQDEAGEEHLPDMSISPPDRRESADLLRPKLGTFDWENSHSGYMGFETEMRTTSPVRKPSGILDDPDIISRRYNAAERDSFYSNSPHARSGTDMLRRDYSGSNADERFRNYNSGETFGINSYGRSSVPELNSKFRNYSVHSDEAPSYGRSTEIDARLQIRAYGVPDEEDHPIGSRFSLGGSGSSLGHSALYPSSAYRLSSPIGDTAAVARYAPRLNEEYRQISPGLPLPSRGMHGMRRDPPPDSFGFAPGNSFSNQGAYGGWVDD